MADMSTRTENRIQVGAAIAFALMALVAIAQHLMSNKVAESMETLKVVAARERVYGELLNMLRDAETGQRGFVIAGHERFLEPYHHATAVIPGILHQLADGAHSADEKRTVAQITQLAEQKLDSMAESIHLRRADGADGAATMVSTGALGS